MPPRHPPPPGHDGPPHIGHGPPHIGHGPPPPPGHHAPPPHGHHAPPPPGHHAPPPPGYHPPLPHGHHVPPPRRSSAGPALAAKEEVAALLEPWLADAEDRSFVARCIATEGPAHHRVASAALLRLLSIAIEAAGGPPAHPAAGARTAPGTAPDDVPVPFRLPPHLDRHADEEAHYPVRLSRRALERLAPPGSHEGRLLADALTDGPPHHALANVAMVNMLETLIERLTGKDGA